MTAFDQFPDACRPPFDPADLDHFISLLDRPPVCSAREWDRRADSWESERAKKRKDDGRITSAVAFLEQRGVLHSGCDVADIGCGPGRFAAAFARKARRVIGLDISEKMAAYGMEHIRSQGLTNAMLRVCDFQTLDIDREGYRNAFDLVFSSMTPAIYNMEGLVKSMEMSRGFCCSITHLYEHNRLHERIMREVFGREPVSRWNGRWFYALFNVLFLMGYYPETSYETRHQEIPAYIDGDYVEYVTARLLPAEERTREAAAAISSWLYGHAGTDGVLPEVIDSCCGRILWDVRIRSRRQKL